MIDNRSFLNFADNIAGGNFIADFGGRLKFPFFIVVNVVDRNTAAYPVAVFFVNFKERTLYSVEYSFDKPRS